MLVAIPLFGSRVSPRCFFSETLVVVKVEEGAIVEQFTHSIRGLSEDSLLDELVELNVDTLVCGGVAQEFIEDALVCGIKIINNVAGELDPVLDALKSGQLAPGFGLSKGRERKPSAWPERAFREVHCLTCAEQNCLKGGPCVLGRFPEVRPLEPVESRIAEVSAEVSFENERRLCRVAELVHFALGMGYRRIGVAFCVEMFKEAELLCEALDRFFEVVPVCCRVGLAFQPVLSGQTGSPSCCNVAAQAELLNQRQTELNLMAGLCVGCDLLFARLSRAPATTLFVKDKSLSHNPVDALYSRRHLEDLAEQSASLNPKGGPS